MNNFSFTSFSKTISIKNFLLICIVLTAFARSNNAFAAAPVITNFSPATGPVGAEVQITGSNFSATATDNAVFFGTLKAVIVSGTQTSLVVKVPAGAAYEQISILANGLRATSVLYFSVTNTYNCALTTHSFESKVDFATGMLPYSIVSGDIDTDGKTDLAITNNLDATISIYKNTSTINSIDAGSFSATTVSIGGGINPTAVLLEDLDGDQKPELIVANNSTAFLHVFPNTSVSGSISFGAKMDIALTYAYAKKITVADLDYDGKPDLITANTSNKSIGLLRNTSTPGSITFDAVYNINTFENPEAIITGDLNGDNMPEIITTNNSTTNIKIFQNKGSFGGFNELSFDGSNSLSTPGGTSNVVKLADFNGDGLLDIVVNSGSTASNRSIAVLKNILPSGTEGTSAPLFAAAVTYAVPDKVTDIAIADFNGDGKLDIAASIQLKNSVVIYLNTITTPGIINANGFTAPVSYTTGTWPGALTLADLDGDGNADLATANTGGGTLSVLKRAQQTNPSASMYFPGYETTTTSCPLKEVSIHVTLTGKSPWTIKYQKNGSPISETITGITSTEENYVYPLIVSPEATTTYKLTQVSDGQLCNGSTIYTINTPLRVIIPETPIIQPNTIPNAAAGSAYRQVFTLLPASLPTSWSVSSAFPSDLTFSNGIISGTPTIRNTYTFTVDAGFSPCAAVKQYSFLISDNSTTWNGTAWSNGKPFNTKDAIINGNYNTAIHGTFSCYHLVVNESDTLFIKQKNPVTIAGNAINNGAIYKDCSEEFVLAGSFAGPAAKIVQPKIMPAFLTSGLINMNYEQPLNISIGESPTYTIINNLPSGLTLVDGIIKGIPDKIGRFDFSIQSTEYDGLCEAAGNFSIYIETADPNLKFPSNGITKIAGTEPFLYSCTSQSKGAITYSIEPQNGCASINHSSGEVTISCGGPVKQYTITAIQLSDYVFKADTATTILSIEKERPTLHFLKTGYVLGSTTGNTIQYQTNSTGTVNIFQLDNNHIARVTTNGIVTPIAEGAFNMLLKITETATTAYLDTIVTIGIYSSFIPPVSTSIDVDLEVGEDTIINILTNAQGITGVIQESLTDIDTENTGVQYKFYSTELGNFLIDDIGNLSIKPFEGFIGKVKIGYVLTDENGTTSDVYYINVNVQPPYVIPPLKANEVMSSNNDGLNDALVIANTDISKENSISIMDEVGNVIYETLNYQNDWQGINMKGKPVENGIYFYIFIEKQSGRDLKQYIQVLR